ncbi:hypothetical protein MTO96_010193, partial [Rhipicephalus appendiculatus]
RTTSRRTTTTKLTSVPLRPSATTVPLRPSATTVPTVKSTSLTPTGSTTTYAPLFQQKPLLICQLTSPGHFAPGGLQQAIVAQEIPSAAICDYTLLDLPLLPNGTYEAISYDFISSKRSGHRHRLLFNVDLDATDTSKSLAIVRNTSFRESVQMAQTTVYPHTIYGLGIIKGLPVLQNPGGAQATEAYLDQLYTEFNKVLTTTNVSWNDIRHFFAFRPNDNVIQPKYNDYLLLLNR